MNERIVFFDGVCNFCNYWVQFALKRDKRNLLKFAPLQGKTARLLLPQHDINPDIITSVIFYDNGKVYVESSAALRVSLYLSSFWKVLYIFNVIPLFIRDRIYKWIGKNRYKWFGKKESCMIPTAEQRQKFLD